MSDTYNYEVLEPGGHARLVGNVLDRISRASANPASAVGSSRAMLGDPETASWMGRTTAADGAALIESVKGNTLVWNQLYKPTDTTTTTSNGITVTNNGDGSITVGGTSTGRAIFNLKLFAAGALISGHKYLVKGCSPAGGSNSTWFGGISGSANDTGSGGIKTMTNSDAAQMRFDVPAAGVTVPETTLWPQLFDLTAMFGAGNEPATVAEFEALFPEPYYPYDAGSLLPVRMEGIETTGFNQWDEEWELGAITANGNYPSTTNIRSANYISCVGGVTYFSKCSTQIVVFQYDENKTLIPLGSSSHTIVNANSEFTTLSNAKYMRFYTQPTYGATYNHDICINISDPARNGTYEPYWSSQRAIPVSTYFPDGMRSAGSVRDELTETQAITRVGAVDLGTLNWMTNSIAVSGVYRMYTTELVNIAAHPSGNSVVGNIVCGKYETLPFESSTSLYGGTTGIAITSGGNVSVYDPNYNTSSSAAAFKAAMSGVYLFYELATPTTQPIDPPLPMSYRTGAGGTERVMVAEGTTSAPPIFATRYPLDPTDLAASIAPVDGPIAKTNHQVGDLLMLGYTLCKATQVIVTGETIAIGTNVTKTTVAAELAALSE